MGENVGPDGALVGLFESSVASAATADVGGAANMRVQVTGSTTITSLGAVANRTRLLRFAGALTLTHHATSLILPGGRSIVTAAGDMALCVSDASGNWKVVFYQRAGGNPVGTTSNIEYVIDGAGSAITTGNKRGLKIDFPCYIEEATLLADQAGSIVIDVWKDSYANYPPVVGDSITASAKPTLSAAAKSTDATLTGWTRTIAAGDVLFFNVDSAATLTWVLVVLRVTRQ